jgi:HPt (histidine-containing phosphotransfer) domain-containing protein
MKDLDFLKNKGIDVDSAIELLGDVDMYNETLDDFLEVSMERMSRLEDSFNDEDMKNYAIDVHALKSDSKYLGFTKLADMALEHQLKSEEGDVDYISDHYEELVDEVDLITSIVKEYLS